MPEAEAPMLPARDFGYRCSCVKFSRRPSSALESLARA